MQNSTAHTEIKVLAKFDDGQLAYGVGRDSRSEERRAKADKVDDGPFTVEGFDEVVAHVVCPFKVHFLYGGRVSKRTSRLFFALSVSPSSTHKIAEPLRWLDIASYCALIEATRGVDKRINSAELGNGFLYDLLRILFVHDIPHGHQRRYFQRIGCGLKCFGRSAHETNSSSSSSGPRLSYVLPSK